MLALSSYFRSQRALTSLALFAVALGGCFLAGIAQTETAPSAVVHLTLDGEAVMEEQTPGPGSKRALPAAGWSGAAEIVGRDSSTKITCG